MTDDSKHRGLSPTEKYMLLLAENHPSGLAKDSIAAQVLNFMNRRGLGLLGLAVAADVVAAACRYNYRMQGGGQSVKKKEYDDEWVLRILEEDEANFERCQAAMAAFIAGGSREALCSEFMAIIEFLNSRP